MFNFSKTEKNILKAAVLILLLFSYFLYDDSLLFPKPPASQNELIGDVAVSKNDVRQKNSDNFSWLPAANQDSIYQHDSIFTGENSKASIRLKDGTIVDIEPNSLVTLNIKDGQMSLDLRYGNITGKIAQGSTLIVNSNGKEMKLDSSKKIEVNRDRMGKTSLGPRVPDVKVELVTPTGTHVAKSKNEDPVNLRWKGRGKISKYEVQISKTPDFADMITNEVTRDQKIDVTQNLDDGNYLWRIRAYDFEGKVALTTPPHSFSVSHQIVPEIVSPVTNAVMSFEILGKLEELRADANIQWTSVTEYPQYHFQVSKNSDFKDPVKDILTPQKTSVTPKLPAGTYYTRVAGYHPDTKTSSKWSAPVSFTLNLTAKQEPKPLAPILLTKKIDFKPPRADDRSPAAVQAPVVQWKPVNAIQKYKMQISKDPQFSNVAEYNVKNPKAVWSQYRPGQYYYRVYSETETGTLSTPSETGVMNITSQEPILNPIPPVQIKGNLKELPPPQEVKVSWTEVSFAKSYVVQMDKDANFSKPEQFEFQGTSGTVKLPTVGTYHMRVQALDEKSKSLSDYSNKQQAVYSFSNPLGIPSLLEPFDKASIFLQKETAPLVWLEWKPVKEATNYRIEISTTPDFSKVILSKTVSDNRFLVKEQIPVGKFFWRVRSETGLEALGSEWSPEREFTLYQKKNEIFIK